MPPEPSPTVPIPVTLLTGFLGSGKTTLLNAMLQDPAFRDTAVVVNEFGSIAIDHDLVWRGQEQYLVTSTGCLCCTTGSDIRASLFALTESGAGGDVPPFSRVIVETTGLADPAPIVNSLLPGGLPATGLRDHVVARTFRLSGVVTVFDAILGELALDRHIECWKQLAFADRIVLTKTDLARDPATRRDVTRLRGRIQALNPAAELLDRHDDAFKLATLYAEGSFSLTRKPEDVVGWLALERALAANPRGHDHDTNRHGDRIRAFPFVEPISLDPRLFDAFLDLLLGQPGVLRLKGIVALGDNPERPMVVHAVQHVLHEKTRLDRWPSEDRRSRIVVIGDSLPEKAIGKLLSAVAARPRWPRRDRTAA